MDIQQHCKNINWEQVVTLLKTCGMGTIAPEKTKTAFTNSFRVFFMFDNTRLTACGRLLSDGVAQGCLYDIAVHPDYQGKGIGTTIVTALTHGLEHMNFMLYASPGKEGFYKTFGFRQAKTCMLRFDDPEKMKRFCYD